MRQVLLSLFYRYGNWGLERVRNLHNISQLLNDGSKIQIWACLTAESKFWTIFSALYSEILSLERHFFSFLNANLFWGQFHVKVLRCYQSPTPCQWVLQILYNLIINWEKCFKETKGNGYGKSKAGQWKVLGLYKKAITRVSMLADKPA